MTLVYVFRFRAGEHGKPRPVLEQLQGLRIEPRPSEPETAAARESVCVLR